MFDDTHYVPILKSRAAEYDALEAEGRSTELLGLTPLIELTPIPAQFIENQPVHSVDAHVLSVERNLLRAWGTERRVFVDMCWLSGKARTADGLHPMRFLLESGRAAELRIVPVVGLACDGEYREAARDGHNDQGACLRLLSADLVRADAEDAVGELLDQLGLARRDVDLVVDLKALNADAVDFNVIGALGILSQVPDVGSWRSFTLAAGAFPENLSEMSPASEQRFARAEWTVWQQLRGRQLDRRPTFADYAIAHPEPAAEMDPRLMRISAQLRYTCQDDWLIFKERNIRDHGNEQFIDICKKLVERPEYAGPDFSWGDKYIAERADGTDARPGNPRIWRKVGTSHHLAMVLSQIASLGA
ncbi:MAG TPA: beta family protein [Solirubrobacteraceae bacterium]|jgi:hypothetical protein